MQSLWHILDLSFTLSAILHTPSEGTCGESEVLSGSSFDNMLFIEQLHLNMLPLIITDKEGNSQSSPILNCLEVKPKTVSHQNPQRGAQHWENYYCLF